MENQVDQVRDYLLRLERGEVHRGGVKFPITPDVARGHRDRETERLVEAGCKLLEIARRVAETMADESVMDIIAVADSLFDSARRRVLVNWLARHAHTKVAKESIQ